MRLINIMIYLTLKVYMKIPDEGFNVSKSCNVSSRECYDRNKKIQFGIRYVCYMIELNISGTPHEYPKATECLKGNMKHRRM